MSAAGAPLLMRVISSSVAVANRAANIIREIMKKGELGIVEKTHVVLDMEGIDAPLLMRVIASSVTVANHAADIIRNIMKKGELGIVEKGKNDLQTEADRSAQRCIVASLHKQFPNIPVIGEEDHHFSINPRISEYLKSLVPPPSLSDKTKIILPELDTKELPPEHLELGFSEEVLKCNCPDEYKDVKDEDIVIWVDPVDGTAEYTQGLLDHVTTLIGISVKGEARAGVIHQPYYNYQAGPDAQLGRCIWALMGLGSFGFQRETPPANERIITTTRSHSDEIITKSVEACEPSSILRVGGAGHKVLLLIEGKVHAYVFASPGCKKWDTCAPEAVLHSVGGKLTDIHGNYMKYSADVTHKNTGGVLATLSNHQWYVDKIPEVARTKLTPDPLSIRQTTK